jgi:signal transduction histidine kinase
VSTSEARLNQPWPILRRRENGRFILFSIALTLPVVGTIAWNAYLERASIGSRWGELAIWVAAFALLNLLDLSAWSGRSLSPDMPVYVAICLTFSPPVAGLIAFVGALDPREFDGRLSISRSLFNRSQQGLLAILAASAIKPLGTGFLPEKLLLGAIITLLTITVANYILVALAARIADGIPLAVSMEHLRLGKLQDFVTTWGAWGLMGLLLVAAYRSIGVLAVIVFTVPAFLGRQVLQRSRAVMLAETQIAEKKRAIAALTERVADERRDERQRVASHLHDEVLQPLYQVTLMCEVTKQDMDRGRLLELDKDLPLLRIASDTASANLRSFIKTLRDSPIGFKGLSSTLRSLVHDMQSRSRLTLVDEVEDVEGIDPQLQLTVYQVAKEAIVNAAVHSRGTQITIHLSLDADALRLSVEDDGIGFDPGASERDHFGVLIMRERVESVGGLLHIDSSLGEGTIVAARFPIPSPHAGASDRD